MDITKKTKGRDKLPDSEQKVPLRIWVKRGHIELLGGEKKLQMDLQDDIEFKVLAKSN